MQIDKELFLRLAPLKATREGIEKDKYTINDKIKNLDLSFLRA